MVLFHPIPASRKGGLGDHLAMNFLWVSLRFSIEMPSFPNMVIWFSFGYHKNTIKSNKTMEHYKHPMFLPSAPSDALPVPSPLQRFPDWILLDPLGIQKTIHSNTWETQTMTCFLLVGKNLSNHLPMDSTLLILRQKILPGLVLRNCFQGKKVCYAPIVRRFLNTM